MINIIFNIINIRNIIIYNNIVTNIINIYVNIIVNICQVIAVKIRYSQHLTRQQYDEFYLQGEFKIRF